MLTSKDVLERTGISRATLNNYIAAGLLPRPQVLPPSPDDGAAPRIGYFPSDTVDRIGEIQRLKSQGWSIPRISAHLSGAPQAGPAGPAASPPARVAVPQHSPAPVPSRASEGLRPSITRLQPPTLTSVAVLATVLQDAGKLWLQLPAREYFELVSEIWAELDAVFARHGGRHGRHPGEGMLCHFVPEAGPAYLWSALAAAQGARDAMRQVSSRWQARKGWDLELCMNTGLDEGQEWIGALRLVNPPELTVVGAAADHAMQLSRLARGGAIWMTRDLVGKLTVTERERITYGVPRAGAEGRLLSTFTRLEELAAHAQTGPVVPALADLPVTELITLAAAAA